VTSPSKFFSPFTHVRLSLSSPKPTQHPNKSQAGVIHGDFEKGFIKAEVVAYQDFHDLCEGGKSMGPIKAAGKYRQEGKTYVVQDGDIIHFQFSKLLFSREM